MPSGPTRKKKEPSVKAPLFLFLGHWNVMAHVSGLWALFWTSKAKAYSKHGLRNTYRAFCPRRTIWFYNPKTDYMIPICKDILSREIGSRVGYSELRNLLGNHSTWHVNVGQHSFSILRHKQTFFFSLENQAICKLENKKL